MSHKPVVSDELENLVHLIESTNIGELEKRQAYRKLVNKCIDEFSVSTKSRALDSVIEEANRSAKRTKRRTGIRITD